MPNSAATGEPENADSFVYGIRSGTALRDWTPVSAPRQLNGSDDVLPLPRAWTEPIHATLDEVAT